MEYNWSYEDIKNDLDTILKKAYRTKDPIKRSKYLCAYNEVNSILANYYMDFVGTRKSIVNQLREVTNDYYLNERYFSLIDSFEATCSSCNDLINNYNLDLLMDNDKKYRYISNEHAFTLVHDFFLNTDQDFAKLFLKLYKDRYKSVLFEESNFINSISGTYGSCQFIDVVNKNYISVQDCQGIQKVSCLAHECGHAVSNLYRPSNVYNSKDEFLSEVPSIFFEWTFIEEVSKKLSLWDSLATCFDQFILFHDIAYALAQHKNLVEAFRVNDYMIDKDFYSFLKQEHGLTKGVVLDSIKTNIDSDGCYVISFMVVLELLSIYRQDKKEALRILKKIISLSKNDSYEVINRLGFDFKNIPDEVDLFLSDFQNELELIKKRGK